MDAGYLDIIKGNEGEIQAVAAASNPTHALPTQQRGVDSTATLTTNQKAALVSALARAERNIVLMTGKDDVVSDGTRTFVVEGGHEIMGRVTGTGCVLGTAISACVAAYGGDRLAAVVAALVLFGAAGERAAADGAGPGSFVPRFLDELDSLRRTDYNDYASTNWYDCAEVWQAVDPADMDME
ncbi:hydroxyethylthiazole kinase [Candidatus Bathyarchaeota archaeon]|nr:hydroxyethylthiazole kinase [Candidatus Bathyarchaeota archaeon]